MCIIQIFLLAILVIVLNNYNNIFWLDKKIEYTSIGIII